MWNVSKIGNDTTHFGNIPIEFLENLLYYYTEPFDVVYDPFAGGKYKKEEMSKITIPLLYSFTPRTDYSELMCQIYAFWYEG